jgi:hypothetical protein
VNKEEKAAIERIVKQNKPVFWVRTYFDGAMAVRVIFL